MKFLQNKDENIFDEYDKYFLNRLFLQIYGINKIFKFLDKIKNEYDAQIVRK